MQRHVTCTTFERVMSQIRSCRQCSKFGTAFRCAVNLGQPSVARSTFYIRGCDNLVQLPSFYQGSEPLT